MRRVRLTMSVLLGIVVSAAVIGCGHSAGRSTSKPASVALSYVKDVYALRVEQAAALVSPSSRAQFRASLTQAAGRDLSARGLAVGSVTMSGSRAIVVLTGTLCSGAAPHPTCRSNAQPHSTDPAFTVTVERTGTDTWYVVSSAAHASQ